MCVICSPRRLVGWQSRFLQRLSSLQQIDFNFSVSSVPWASLVPRLFYLVEEKKSLVTTVCVCAKFWRNSVKIVYYCSRPCSAWRTITSRFLTAQAWQRLMILRVLYLLHWIGWATLRWLWRRSSLCGRHVYEGQVVFIWLPTGRSFGIRYSGVGTTFTLGVQKGVGSIVFMTLVSKS